MQRTPRFIVRIGSAPMSISQRSMDGNGMMAVCSTLPTGFHVSCDDDVCTLAMLMMLTMSDNDDDNGIADDDHEERDDGDAVAEPQQPDNNGDNEYCMEMFGAWSEHGADWYGQWNDLQCYMKRAYICKMVPGN